MKHKGVYCRCIDTGSLTICDFYFNGKATGGYHMVDTCYNHLLDEEVNEEDWDEYEIDSCLPAFFVLNKGITSKYD